MVKWLRYMWMMLMPGIADYVSAQTGQSVHMVQGSAITLRADAANALSYLWFRNNEPINGFHDQRIVVSEAGTYTVMALGNDCNSDVSDPVEVIVDPGGEPMVVDMQIRNAPDRQLAMINEIFSYQLMAVNNGTQTATGVAVTAKLPANVNYETALGAYVGEVTYSAAKREVTWLPGDMAPGHAETLVISVRASNPGTATQLAIVTTTEPDSNPADNEAAATVEVVALEIPNGFTPNGDGLNDHFEIRGLEFYPENRLLIFNRWGNEVYRITGYKNDWDGASLSAGTYYYIFELRLHSGHWQTFKGFVTIVRNVTR